MKIIKNLILVFLTMAFLNACNEETVLLSEGAELPAKTLGKEHLGAMMAPTPITQGLFALYPWDYVNGFDVAVYDYNSSNDDLSFIQYQNTSSDFSNKFGFDFNSEDGRVYLLASSYNQEEEGNGRNLYVYDMQSNSSQFITEIESYNGNTKPNDLTFGKNGTLYFVFQSGEINAYNLITQSMTPVANVPQYGGVGLTYDFDNDRLIYVTDNSPNELYAIDIATGNVNFLFSFYAPDDNYGSAQAIEYIGNNKCIVSSTYSANKIYTADLASNTVELLVSPTGSFDNIKDLMYISYDSDNDGCLNEDDDHPNSNLSETVIIGSCDTGITNKFVNCGTTMADEVDDLIAEVWAKVGSSRYYRPQSDFTWKMYMLASQWQYKRLITRLERDAIMRCVYRNNLFTPI